MISSQRPRQDPTVLRTGESELVIAGLLSKHFWLPYKALFRILAARKLEQEQKISTKQGVVLRRIFFRHRYRIHATAHCSHSPSYIPASELCVLWNDAWNRTSGTRRTEQADLPASVRVYLTLNWQSAVCISHWLPASVRV